MFRNRSAWSRTATSRSVPANSRDSPSVFRFFWGEDVAIQTNSEGFRDDSFAFGWGVDNGEIFTDRLRELLDGVEVINLAVTGCSGIATAAR